MYVSLVKKGVDLEKKRLDREERQRQIKIKEIQNLEDGGMGKFLTTDSVNQMDYKEKSNVKKKMQSVTSSANKYSNKDYYSYQAYLLDTLPELGLDAINQDGLTDQDAQMSDYRIDILGEKYFENLLGVNKNQSYNYKQKKAHVCNGVTADHNLE